ncbi:hypothetical protein TWF694_009501 [Orbilia ellipsospora]|uniref:Cerato-platanin n=1 Tax=Orbilia ellipsospora TaxID=2528407 RepID=A0AAV9XBC1_9PEZI
MQLTSVLTLLVASVSASQLRWDTNYNDAASIPLVNIACSDHTNGFITKYHFPRTANTQQLRTKLQPGVHFAARDVTWAVDKNCGQCWLAKSTDGKRSAYFTTIDHADGTIVAGQEMFKALSAHGTTSEGVLTVYIYDQPRSKCWKS